MIKHYIIMSSSYTDGSRVALDITEDCFLNSKAIAEMIEEIRKNCGKDVPLSTHFIETESASWDSVVAYDPFFEDVECTKSTTAFSEKIKKGRVLSGLDVANYILSKIRCTHLSLEKLVYYAYADYLCEHSERLFEDHIYAFRHGPVINSVYETFKRSGSQYVKPFEFGDDSDIRTGVKELPARSRILFAKEGTEKLSSIDRTIAKYGKYSAGALVDLTHRAGTPWSYVKTAISQLNYRNVRTVEREQRSPIPRYIGASAAMFPLSMSIALFAALRENELDQIFALCFRRKGFCWRSCWVVRLNIRTLRSGIHQEIIITQMVRRSPLQPVRQNMLMRIMSERN